MMKPTNPKDAMASSKLPLDLVPDVLMVEAATAFAEGALKYGRYNWRIAGVRSSIYVSALLRHVFKWWNGEDRDQSTRVRHLANALACIGIILDAELQGMLNDDRPPAQPQLSKRIDELSETIKHLQTLFADKTSTVFVPIAREVVYHTDQRPSPSSITLLRDNGWGVNPRDES